MATFDSTTLRGVVESLSLRAGMMLFTHSVFWGSVGAAAAGYFFRQGGWALAGFVLGCIVGYSMASTRAMQLRYQAQTALCLIHIEENTRRPIAEPRLSGEPILVT